MRRVLVQCGPLLGWSMAFMAITGLGVALLGGPSRAAPAEASSYKTLEAQIDPLYKTKDGLRNESQKFRGIVSGAVSVSGNEATLDNYLTKYLFPNWTLIDEENLGSLAKDRERFMIELAKSPPQVHDQLLNRTFDAMKQIAEDPAFHPGVRYNAVLVLGSLNSKEVDRINKTNPEPLSRALPVLVDRFKKADESDAVRLAALLGILRHLEWDNFRPQASRMAAATKTDIVNELKTLAEASTPPAGRSLEGHTWMRRRAVEGLMYAALSGTTPEITSVIEKLIGSDAEPIALRCTAADVMGRLDFQAPATPPAPEPTAKELGYLALVACNAELTKLEDQRKQDDLRAKSQNRFGGAMSGGMGVPGMDGAASRTPGAGAMPKGPGMMGGMGSKGKVAGGPPDMKGMTAGMMGGMPGGKGKVKAPKPTKKKEAGGATQDLLAPGAMPGNDLLAPADPNAYRLDYLRRRLRAWLYAVQMGLGDEKANPHNEVKRSGFGKDAKTTETYTRGVVAFAQAQERTYVKDVIDKTRNVIKVVEAPDLDAEAFAEELRTAMKELELITKPLEQPKTKATEPADEVPGAAASASAKGKAPAPAAEAAAEVPMAPATPPAGKAAEGATAPAATDGRKGAAPPAADAGKGAAPPAATPAAPPTKSP